MASVGEIRLYPVKGLDPVIVGEARISGSGALEWDRRFALVDSRGRFLNGKNRVEIHAIRATFELAKAEMALDGRSFSMLREGDAIAAWFTERIGERFAWIEDTAMGFPDDTASPGPTIVSEASLCTVAEWFSLEAEQTRRRFRANITVQDLEAFAEDRWYGSAIRVGPATVQVINPCARCVVPSRDTFTGVQDMMFQKRFAELRKQHLPAWADPQYFNHHYRFTVNTRIAAPEAGKVIRAGDSVGE
jgi:uncharacterized protein YcbX